MASYVGFANLPNQVHRKSVKKGFEFTLMVVGEFSGYSFQQMALYLISVAVMMTYMNYWNMLTVI